MGSGERYIARGPSWCRYARVPSWTWPGAPYGRFGAWRHRSGFTLRYRSHLLIVHLPLVATREDHPALKARAAASGGGERANG